MRRVRGAREAAFPGLLAGRGDPLLDHRPELNLVSAAAGTVSHEPDVAGCRIRWIASPREERTILGTDTIRI
jgi:hypothetical protein